MRVSYIGLRLTRMDLSASLGDALIGANKSMGLHTDRKIVRLPALFGLINSIAMMSQMKGYGSARPILGDRMSSVVSQ